MLCVLLILVFVAEGTQQIINVAEVPISVTGLTTTNNASVNSLVTEAEVCATDKCAKEVLSIRFQGGDIGLNDTSVPTNIYK